MRCTYCPCTVNVQKGDTKSGFLVTHTELNDQYGGTVSFSLPFCSLDCFNAYGLRQWRRYHNLPHDPDQLNWLENDVAPHDPVWDVERWIRQ